MGRLLTAFLLSACLHGAVFAGEGLFLFRGPEIAVSRGETRVALFLTPSQPEEPSPEPAEKPRPEEPAPAAQAPEEEGVEETPPGYHRNLPPAYPREAFLKNIQGTVWVLADLDRKGIPSGVRVERSSGSPLLDEAARQAVTGWRFSPARRAGVAVAGSVRIPIHFQIVAGKPTSRMKGTRR